MHAKLRLVFIHVVSFYLSQKYAILYLFFLNYSYRNFYNNTDYIILYGKKDFAEGSKILLDTDLKIILLDYQNNFVEILKITSNAAKNLDILATSLNVLHNYFDSLKKFLF